MWAGSQSPASTSGRNRTHSRPPMDKSQPLDAGHARRGPSLPRPRTAPDQAPGSLMASPDHLYSASSSISPNPLQVSPRSPIPQTSRRRESNAAGSRRPRATTTTPAGSYPTMNSNSSSRLETDMKRLLSKPAPPSSSMGNTSFFSSSLDQEDDNPLSFSFSSSSVNTSYLRAGADQIWSPDTPLSALGSDKSAPQDAASARSRQSTTARKHPSRSRAHTQTSTSSSFIQSPINQTNLSQQESSFPTDYVLDGHQNARLPLPDHSSPTPPRAMTPASAIAYAYQQKQQQNSRSNATPSPSFYASSSSDGGSRLDSKQQPRQMRTASSPRALESSTGILVAEDPDASLPPPKDGALRSLTRKVSGKFSKGNRKSRATSSHGRVEDPVISGSLGTSGSSALAASSSEFGDFEPVYPTFLAGSSTTGTGDRGRGVSLGSRSFTRDSSQYSRSNQSHEFIADPNAFPVPPSVTQSPAAATHPRPNKLLKSKSHLRLNAHRSASDPPYTPGSLTSESMPATPGTVSSGGGSTSGSGGVGASLKRLMKKLSTSTLKEKRSSSTGLGQPISSPLEAPPVPPLPRDIDLDSRRSSVSEHDYGVVVSQGRGFGQENTPSERHSIVSKSSKKAVGRSRSGTVVSSQQHQHQPPAPYWQQQIPRSPLNTHKRSFSQSGKTTTTSTSAALSSSPISSDLSSSQFFFNRGGPSPRTSTSSYAPDVDVTPPPPLPKQPQQHIIPPEEIYATMLKEYGDTLRYVDDAGSDDAHGRRSTASSTPYPASSISMSRTPSGLSAPPSRQRSRSREPSSRKSSSSVKRDRDGSPDSRSGARSMRSGKIPSLPLASNVLLPPKYVTVQQVEDAQTPPSSANFITVNTPSSAKTIKVATVSPARKGVFHRLTKSKSEASIAVPAPTVSPPVPSPARPTTVAPNLPLEPNSPTAPSSPTRAASFDSPAARPLSLSTTVAFRELKAPKKSKTEEEKARMWDALLEKSERAGGTLHAKIDSLY